MGAIPQLRVPLFSRDPSLFQTDKDQAAQLTFALIPGFRPQHSISQLWSIPACGGQSQLGLQGHSQLPHPYPHPQRSSGSLGAAWKLQEAEVHLLPPASSFLCEPLLNVVALGAREAKGNSHGYSGPQTESCRSSREAVCPEPAGVAGRLCAQSPGSADSVDGTPCGSPAFAETPDCPK